MIFWIILAIIAVIGWFTNHFVAALVVDLGLIVGLLAVIGIVGVKVFKNNFK